MSGPIRTTLDALKTFAAALGLSLEQAADVLDHYRAAHPASSAPGPTPASPSSPALAPIVPADPLVDLPTDGKAH